MYIYGIKFLTMTTEQLAQGKKLEANILALEKVLLSWERSKEATSIQVVYTGSSGYKASETLNVLDEEFNVLKALMISKVRKALEEDKAKLASL